MEMITSVYRSVIEAQSRVQQIRAISGASEGEAADMYGRVVRAVTANRDKPDVAWAQFKNALGFLSNCEDAVEAVEAWYDMALTARQAMALYGGFAGFLEWRRVPQ